MFLLSEFKKKYDTDIASLPTAPSVEIRLQPGIRNLRDGDERVLLELLVLAAEKLCRTRERYVLHLGGTDEELLAAFRRKGADEGDFAEIPPDLRGKIEALGGRTAGGEMRLPMPAAVDSPAVDLKSVVDRTGLSDDQVRSILKEFIADGKRNLAAVSGGGPLREPAERIRAAHSLKGSGKSMCAPELASAAAEVEEDLLNQADTEESISRLEGVWERVEKWYTDGAE